MTTKDKENLKSLKESLNNSDYSVIIEENSRDTESLYRFGWYHINGYKYSVSGWAFQKNVVTFESETGEKVKYSISENKSIFGEFKKDNFIDSIQKKIRNNLADWLKDLSDKLRT